MSSPVLFSPLTLFLNVILGFTFSESSVARYLLTIKIVEFRPTDCLYCELYFQQLFAQRDLMMFALFKHKCELTVKWDTLHCSSHRQIIAWLLSFFSQVKLFQLYVLNITHSCRHHFLSSCIKPLLLCCFFRVCSLMRRMVSTQARSSLVRPKSSLMYSGCQGSNLCSAGSASSGWW